MRVLTIAALIALVSALHSCAPRGALTPEDAYYMLGKACREGDAAAVENLLSRNTLARIGSIARIFADMGESQRKAVALEVGVDEGALLGISQRQYIALQLKLDAARGGANIGAMLSARIAGVTALEKSATVRTRGGMAFRLVREGPYWKFDGDLF